MRVGLAQNLGGSGATCVVTHSGGGVMARTGVVYTETVVHAAPAAFAEEAPYQVAIVDLSKAAQVTARIVGRAGGDRGCGVGSRKRTWRSGFHGIGTEMKLAGRMERILVESAFDVLVRARALEAQGRSVIHLEIGEPDFPTPAHIIEAGKKALDEGWTHYGPTPGLPELREAIASHVSETRGIEVGPQHVSVVPGGKPIIFFPMMALLEPGDEVIYPNPGFPIYESMIGFLGATPVPVPLVEERGFSFDLDVCATA